MGNARPPLSLSEILGRTAFIYRNNFLLLISIAAIDACSMLAFELLSLYLTQYNVPGKIFYIFLLEIPMIFILPVLVHSALCQAVAWVHLDQSVSFRRTFAHVLPKLSRYVWLIFLTGLRILWPILLFLPLAIFLVPGVVPISTTFKVILGIATAVCAIGFFVYIVWMSLRYALSMPACVLEDLKASAALRRSVSLTKGQLWNVFVLFLIVGCIALVGMIVMHLPVALFGSGNVFFHPERLSPGLRVLTYLLNSVYNMFMVPVYSALITIFYYDRRVCLEGFGAEPIAEAEISASSQVELVTDESSELLDPSEADDHNSNGL